MSRYLQPPALTVRQARALIEAVNRARAAMPEATRRAAVAGAERLDQLVQDHEREQQGA